MGTNGYIQSAAVTIRVLPILDCDIMSRSTLICRLSDPVGVDPKRLRCVGESNCRLCRVNGVRCINVNNIADRSGVYAGRSLQRALPRYPTLHFLLKPEEQ